MTAHVFITCPSHPSVLMCDDDQAYSVETVSAALVLHAAQYPDATGKIARIAITCELGGCMQRLVLKADSVTAARTRAAGHDFGFYVARRAGGRLADGCQYHLGSCCVVHAHADSPTLDPAAVLPEHAPESATAQLDLFGEVA